MYGSRGKRYGENESRWRDANPGRCTYRRVLAVHHGPMKEISRREATAGAALCPLVACGLPWCHRYSINLVRSSSSSLLEAPDTREALAGWNARGEAGRLSDACMCGDSPRGPRAQTVPETSWSRSCHAVVEAKPRGNGWVRGKSVAVSPRRRARGTEPVAVPGVPHSSAGVSSSGAS